MTYAISKQTINLSVSALIKNNYISVYQSPTNKKEKLITLTDKGNVIKRFTIPKCSKRSAKIVEQFGLEKAILLESLVQEYEAITGEFLVDKIKIIKKIPVDLKF